MINYHGTPKSLMPNFEQHLEYYRKHFHILNPDEFEEICKGGKRPDTLKASLLLTFDDGMKNNINAIRLLNENNVKACFFVIPAFIESDQPRDFLSTFIRPGYVNKMETEEEDFTPMGWETLREAISEGHKIGSHTYSHTLVKGDNEEKSTFEILESKKCIESRLSIEVPYFCSINNTDISVGKMQEDLINRYYNYHFTTYYGYNFPTPAPGRIERINIESYWNMNELRYALGNIRRIMIKK